MRYLYFQPADGGRFDPGSDTLAGRDFVLAHEGDVPAPDPDPHQTAQKLSALLASEDRPRAREIRTIAAGDVLALNPSGPNATWLQLGPSGEFRRVEAVSVRILPGKTLCRGVLVDCRRAARRP